jgi:fructosamine-3-kinase
MDRTVAQVLSANLGGEWTVRPQGGSTFCSTWRAQAASRTTPRDILFVKSGPTAQTDVLQAEADGLAALARAGCIRSPELMGCWIDASLDIVVLAMEWLDLASSSAWQFGEQFGRQLATLHLTPAEEANGRFGWGRDNWLGGTPQRNRWSKQDGLEGWLAFFAEERLGAMAEKLARAGATPGLVNAVGRLIDALPGFFADGHVPRPSLVHGDLWSGNWGCLHDGAPVIYDPAVSISDAEAELAMMELFGSPPSGFWGAYREVAPVAEGYVHRRNLYQLYHLLNHALLFGSGYARQALTVIDTLLAAR